MARIPLISPESLTEAQRLVYERIVAGPRKVIVGPLRAALHNPELAEHWQQLGALLRYRTSLSPRVKELAILLTARRWNAELEWQMHEPEARSAGVPDAVIAAIREGWVPECEEAADAEVCAFAVELQQAGRVSEPTYRAAERRFGTVGVVELTALIGYYTMVAMTLNAHEIALPDGQNRPTLPTLGPGLTTVTGVEDRVRSAERPPT